MSKLEFLVQNISLPILLLSTIFSASFHPYFEKLKKKEGGSENGVGVKIQPFHLPWIRA